MSMFTSTYDSLLPATPFTMGIVMAIIMIIMTMGIMVLNIPSVGPDVCVG